MSAIESFQLSGNGLDVSVTNYGASLQDLRLQGSDMPLVLGFEKAADYATQNSHMGATAGRVANRIAKGYISLDDKIFPLDTNEEGRTTLHGGTEGCGKRLWQAQQHSKTHISFTLEDEDLHMGFPGTVQLTCHYEITAPRTLTIGYEAHTSAPTFVNLAHHSYFRLDDSPDITAHE